MSNKKQENMKEYKMLVLGDSCVGKTTFIRKLLGMPYRPEYVETFCIERHTLPLQNCKVTITDVPVQSYEQFGNSYSEGIDFALILTDNRIHGTTNVKKYIYHLQKNNIPFHIVVNKADLIKHDTFVTNLRTSLRTIPQQDFFCVSCKNNNTDNLRLPLYRIINRKNTV